MTTSTNMKRLDEVEIQLTPKEWAIRLADEFRKHPAMDAFFRAMGEAGPPENTLLFKPYEALQNQAEDRFPGNRPEEVHARIKLNRALRKEFHTLKLLAIEINQDILKRGEVNGLKAALRLARLETMILQDAFGRTARKAAEWIEDIKSNDEDDEMNRRVMLTELAAYTDVYYGEKFSDSIPLPGGLRLRWPSAIEEWIIATGGLVADVFAMKEAVKIIQDKHFDGHPILFLDVEAGLDQTIKTLEKSAATFNDYLQTRGQIFKAEWDAEEEDQGFASAISGEREGKLRIDIDGIRARTAKLGAKAEADQWIKRAKDKAELAILDESGEGLTFAWDRFREEMGMKP